MPSHATSHASRDASRSATKWIWFRRVDQYVSIAVLRKPSYEVYAGLGAFGAVVGSTAMRRTVPPFAERARRRPRRNLPFAATDETMGSRARCDFHHAAAPGP